MKKLPEELTAELLKLVLGDCEVQGMKSFGLSSGGDYLLMQFCEFDDSINIDTLTRLLEDWIIGDTNEILNTYNSTSVKGWVATSSIYNFRCIGESRFIATLKLAEKIAKEREERGR